MGKFKKAVPSKESANDTSVSSPPAAGMGVSSVQSTLDSTATAPGLSGSPVPPVPDVNRAKSIPTSVPTTPLLPVPDVDGAESIPTSVATTPAVLAASETFATAVEDSPLRTMAIEPTPRNAQLQEFILEETPQEDVQQAHEERKFAEEILSSATPSCTEVTKYAGPPTKGSPLIVPRNRRASGGISPTSLSPLRERENARSPTHWEKKLEENAHEYPVPIMSNTDKENTWLPLSTDVGSMESTKEEADRLERRRGRVQPTAYEGQREFNKFPLVGSVFCIKDFVPKVWGETGLKTHERFKKSRYANLGTDPKARKERAISSLVTELEAREINRRRRRAADAIFAEQVRLEMEATVCLELDNTERQRGRIQAIEEEEEERWRRIEEYHLHASTPLHLKSQREDSLVSVLESEAKERARRMSEDGIQSMSGRSKYADYSRKAINAELCRIVWPGVESWAPVGEQEAPLPPGRSRRNPGAVLYFCLSQRNLLHRTPRRKLVTLQVCPVISSSLVFRESRVCRVTLFQVDDDGDCLWNLRP